MDNDSKPLQMVNKHAQKAGQLCGIRRRHTVKHFRHCPKENKWETFNIQSGFAGLREGTQLKNSLSRGNKRCGADAFIDKL